VNSSIISSATNPFSEDSPFKPRGALESSLATNSVAEDSLVVSSFPVTSRNLNVHIESGSRLENEFDSAKDIMSPTNKYVTVHPSSRESRLLDDNQDESLKFQSMRAKIKLQVLKKYKEDEKKRHEELKKQAEELSGNPMDQQKQLNSLGISGKLHKPRKRPPLKRIRSFTEC